MPGDLPVQFLSALDANCFLVISQNIENTFDQVLVLHDFHLWECVESKFVVWIIFKQIKLELKPDLSYLDLLLFILCLFIDLLVGMVKISARFVMAMCSLLVVLWWLGSFFDCWIQFLFNERFFFGFELKKFILVEFVFVFLSGIEQSISVCNQLIALKLLPIFSESQSSTKSTFLLLSGALSILAH